MPALSYATKPVTAAIVADYIVFSGAAASTAAIATVAGPRSHLLLFLWG